VAVCGVWYLEAQPRDECVRVHRYTTSTQSGNACEATAPSPAGELRRREQRQGEDGDGGEVEEDEDWWNATLERKQIVALRNKLSRLGEHAKSIRGAECVRVHWRAREIYPRSRVCKGTLFSTSTQ
jgi:hypothetical protein